MNQTDWQLVFEGSSALLLLLILFVVIWRS